MIKPTSGKSLCAPSTYCTYIRQSPRHPTAPGHAERKSSRKAYLQGGSSTVRHSPVRRVRHSVRHHLSGRGPEPHRLDHLRQVQDLPCRTCAPGGRGWMVLCRVGERGADGDAAACEGGCRAAASCAPDKLGSGWVLGVSRPQHLSPCDELLASTSASSSLVATVSCTVYP
jgi:hypothetical protein